MLGAAASRPRLGAVLGEFLARTQIPFFTTQMGKGVVAGTPAGQSVDLWDGNRGALWERDYVHEAIDRADLILAIGHDTVEKPPFLMGARPAPTVIHVGYTAGHGRRSISRTPSIVGDIGPSLLMLADRLDGRTAERTRRLLPLRDDILRQVMEGSAPEDRFPLVPQRIVARCPHGDAAGRDCGAGQRHVQDLVCAQLPHAPCRRRCCWTTHWPPWVPVCRRR